MSTEQTPTPFAVHCPAHGLRYLTEEQYSQQLAAPGDTWLCPEPACGIRARWDDDIYDKALAAGELQALVEKEEAALKASAAEKEPHMQPTIPDCFKDKIFIFSYDPEPTRMMGAPYGNGRLRIDFVTETEPFATLTTNLVGEDPGENGFFVKTWSENAPLIKELLASGVFIDTGRRADTGHVTASVWKFAKGRIVRFENAEMLEDELVRIQTGGGGLEADVPAKKVPLGELAWRIHQIRPGKSRDERSLGARLLTAPVCPYCGANSEHVDGKVVYPHRPDLAEKRFWLCRPCDAYVGCHDGTPEPLGRLANAELRKMKSAAHSAFDPLWRDGHMKRSAAYKRLAEHLGLDSEQCHIGMFDVAMCAKVIAFSKEGWQRVR
jgi:hypothetical protein